MSRLLPRSLRARLILSFGLLIFITVFLAGLTTVYLLREQQERNARERVGLLAELVALNSAFLEVQDATPQQIREVLIEQYPGEQILVVDSFGRVVADTAGTLQGQTISQVAEGTGATHTDGDDRYWSEKWQDAPGGDLLIFVANRGRLEPALFTPEYRTIVAVEESDLREAWRDLVPRLFLAGGVASFAGVIVAGVLARSITRPIRRITLASEAMARGNYDQRIPAYGGDEVGRLATAFNDMAQQVNRSYRTLRDFLANVSHELKTPLTSIQGFSQAMVDGSLQKPEDYAEAGRIVNDEAVRMRSLVDDLLYLSQVDRGEFSVQLEPIWPNELLDATHERFIRRASQENVTLQVLPRTTPQIQADGRRLEQALANIVDNAVRHTPEGGSVTLRSFAENGHVRISVHNTGSTIPEEALPNVFDRFFQADPAGARADANTGLGLAITKEIVEAHGGHVDVKSTEIGGTEFAITLPLDGKPVPHQASARDTKQG
jgi:signal transduction histidine kinase